MIMSTVDKKSVKKSNRSIVGKFKRNPAKSNTMSIKQDVYHNEEITELDWKKVADNLNKCILEQNRMIDNFVLLNYIDERLEKRNDLINDCYYYLKKTIGMFEELFQDNEIDL